MFHLACQFYDIKNKLCDAFLFVLLQTRSSSAIANPRSRRELLLQGDQQHAVSNGPAVLPEGSSHAEAAAQQWIRSSKVGPLSTLNETH